MAYFEYTLGIEHISGQDTLVSVTVNGTVYTAPTPFVMSAANVSAILAWLNSTIPAYLWLSEYITDNDTGLSYLNIYTACTYAASADTITAQVVVSEVAETIEAVSNDCDQAACSGITATIKVALEIDCANQCLNFSDVTGVYSTSNTGGYGSPNFPALTNFASVTFTLLNAGGTTLGSPYTSTYRPTDPFGSICLTPANFGLTSFTGNTVYQLKYTIVTSGTVITCSPYQIPFRMPCCGSVLVSGLAPSILLTQQPDAKSLAFTDTTYAYATPDNTGGYGTPNPDYSDVSHTEFVVTRPDGQVIAFDIGYVPSAINNVGVITNENLGYTQSEISDGVYKIVFNVYAIPASSECLLASITVYTVLFQQTYNCLYNQGISLLSGCDTKAKKQWNADWNELQMIIAASLNNVDCVTGKVERLLARCKQNCTTC